MTPSRLTERSWTASARLRPWGSGRERATLASEPWVWRLCAPERSEGVSAELLGVLRRHKEGEPVGVTSICSAHPLVLRAALAQARDDGSVALVEATSNQVDQFGGYTRMGPGDFRDFVPQLPEAGGPPPGRVGLRGDQFGPEPWGHQPAPPATGAGRAPL